MMPARWLAPLGARLRASAAELALAAAILIGWALVTHGVSAGLSRFVSHGVVWSLSTGLLILSGAGWGLLFDMARHGLYVLSAREPVRSAAHLPMRPRGKRSTTEAA